MSRFCVVALFCVGARATAAFTFPHSSLRSTAFRTSAVRTRHIRTVVNIAHMSSSCGRDKLQDRDVLAGYDEQQVQMMSEAVILVDEHDHVIGQESKVNSHLVSYGPKLHRAFSLFLFNGQGKLLMQKRADSKVTFPGHWTNTCCSHPLHTTGELGTDVNDAITGTMRAVVRKLEQELGVPVAQIPLGELQYVTKIHYLANSDPQWGEHEIDYIFIAQVDVSLDENPNEVSSTRYVDQEELEQMFEQYKLGEIQMTPWCVHIMEQFLFGWWDQLLKQGPKAISPDDQIHRMGSCKRDAEFHGMIAPLPTSL